MADTQAVIADSDSHKTTGTASRLLVRHTSYYVLGRVLTGIVGLASLVVFTRLLSSDEYGRYAVFVAIGGAVSAVVFQWIRQCLVRFGVGAVADRQPLLGTLGLLFATLLALTMLVMVVLASPLGRLLRVSFTGPELAVIASIVVATSCFEFCIDAARTDFRPWRYNLAIFVRALLTLVVGACVAALTHNGLDVVVAVAIAYSISILVAMPPWLVGVLRVDKATWKVAKQLIVYGVPLAGTLGLNYVLDSADRLMLAAMSGYAEAGVYSSAYNLAQFSIGATLAGLGLGALPLAVGAITNEGRLQVARFLGKNLILGMAITFPAVTGLVVLAPMLGKLLLGNYVPHKSEVIIIIVAIAAGLSALRSYCVDIVFMLQRRTWIQSIIIGVVTIINVALNIIFIPMWGGIGAAYATLIAFALAIIGSWILSRRELQIPFEWVETAKIAIACSAMAITLLLVRSVFNGWVWLLMNVVTGAVVYLAIVIGLNVRGTRARLVSIIRKM